MCLAIPMRIKSIDGDEAEVETNGVSYKANISLTPNAQVGDYVLLHTGYTIGILDTEEAGKTLSLFLSMEIASNHED